MSEKLRIAIQKSGRLFERSKDLLNKIGIQFEYDSRKLLIDCDNFPLQILFVRDDDIPSYLKDGACDLGVVGYNEYFEKILAPFLLTDNKSKPTVEVEKKLGFGKCKLTIAIPKHNFNAELTTRDLIKQFKHPKLATSYPNTLNWYLKRLDIAAEIIEVTGSVEITPTLGLTNGICDLVSTGATLKSNGLIPIEDILQSEAVLLKSNTSFWNEEKLLLLKKICVRIEGVQRAKNAKYLMMNAPKSSIDKIKNIIPGLDYPTILPLHGSNDYVAIHVVINEEVFWDSMEQLRELGASSILVVPIEKILA